MLRIAVFGAGRIGKIHASNVARNPRTRLAAVVDPIADSGRALARSLNAPWTGDADAAIGDREVDAVLIASPSDTHVSLIERAAAAGKPILCEKPLDVDIAKVDRCLASLAKTPVPLLLGFNRRFDPSAEALQRAIAAGEIGTVRQVIITSRDPSPPPLQMLPSTGGLFRDMTIHDFDMGRWLLGEEPVEVWATASCLVNPEIGTRYSDYDTAMIVMRTQSGRQCHINNCRQAAYGYDQRLEVFGSEGMLANDNLRATTVRKFSAAVTESREPLLNFFLERYAQSYMRELDAFVDALEAKRPMPVTAADGRRALLLADAAFQSVKSGQAVSVA
jgi:myo-inositol 2-dehydrogenase / D-chiro-inositol 1-dehydrogenase